MSFDPMYVPPRPSGISMPNPHERMDPREDEREQATPILNHIYQGPAWRLDKLGEGHHECITGAFRVIERGKMFAVLGNGEVPEGVWMIFSEDLAWLERAC